MRLTLLKTAELAFTIEAKKIGGTQQKFKSLDFQRYKKNTPYIACDFVHKIYLNIRETLVAKKFS